MSCLDSQLAVYSSGLNDDCLEELSEDSPGLIPESRHLQSHNVPSTSSPRAARGSNAESRIGSPKMGTQALKKVGRSRPLKTSLRAGFVLNVALSKPPLGLFITMRSYNFPSIHTASREWT